MIFIYTSHLVALAIRSDALHDRAPAWTKTLAGPFLTTEYVLVEFVNRLFAIPQRPIAHAVLSSLSKNAAISVLSATPKFFQAGLRLHRDRRDKNWSLTDCISFAIMGDAHMSEALTYDQHFEQAGFNALLRKSPPVTE